MQSNELPIFEMGAPAQSTLTAAEGYPFEGIEESLGLNTPVENELSLVDLTRQGLPLQAVTSIASNLGVSVNDLDQILPVSRRTLQRYLSNVRSLKSLSLELSDHIIQLAKVLARAIDVLGSKTHAQDWLKEPIPALGHRTPLSLLDTSTGIDLVLRELGRIEHGIFS